MKHAKRARTDYLFRRWVYGIMNPRVPLVLIEWHRNSTWQHKKPVDILADINAMLDAIATQRFLPPPPIPVWGKSNMETLLRHPFFRDKGM